MATTQSTSRYADHRAFAQAGSASPFRSTDADERVQAATVMLMQRDAELKTLEVALAQATTGLAKKNLRFRIQATKNNRKAWEAYLATDAVREPRAVMSPFVYPNPLKAG